jgi:hypothetical protein
MAATKPSAIAAALEAGDQVGHHLVPHRVGRGGVDALVGDHLDPVLGQGGEDQHAGAVAGQVQVLGQELAPWPRGAPGPPSAAGGQGAAHGGIETRAAATAKIAACRAI